MRVVWLSVTIGLGALAVGSSGCDLVGKDRCLDRGGAWDSHANRCNLGRRDRGVTRALVASGSTHGEIGRWRIWRSRDAQHRECTEIRLLDHPRGRPSRRRECTTGAGFSVAAITAPHETLVYGRVPARARTVVIGTSDQRTRTGRAVSSPRARPFNYFGVAFPSGRISGLKARALDVRGNEVAATGLRVPAGP